MNQPIRLVVCDLDDTLIHKDLHLSPDIITLAAELNQKGVFFTFATGRMPYRAFSFAKDIGLKIPFVANNGSILYANGEMVYCKKLHAPALKEIIQAEMKRNDDLTVVFSYEDRERPLVVTHWIRERFHKYAGYNEPLGNTDAVWEQDVHKIYLTDEQMTGSIGRIAKCVKQMPEVASCYQYGEFSIEIVAAGCSKATGVARLIEYLHIEKGQVMALGDHTNDIEVLQMVGLGVAVANAVPELKEVADYVTTEERAEGVISAVRKFIG